MSHVARNWDGTSHPTARHDLGIFPVRPGRSGCLFHVHEDRGMLESVVELLFAGPISESLAVVVPVSVVGFAIGQIEIAAQLGDAYVHQILVGIPQMLLGRTEAHMEPDLGSPPHLCDEIICPELLNISTAPTYIDAVGGV